MGEEIRGIVVVKACWLFLPAADVHTFHCDAKPEKGCQSPYHPLKCLSNPGGRPVTKLTKDEILFKFTSAFVGPACIVT
jgi:hypothetical protein